ncbi:hypothetical protein KAR91_82415 [Candidatus Pacearchaeota archaeon]|nr:hypothetical protein [Candidatus Pacearchaeota archaeon]
MPSVLDRFVNQRSGLVQQQGSLVNQASQQAEQDRFLETSNLRSMGIGAMEAKAITDPAAQDQFLARRIEEIEARGGDSRDTREALETPFKQRQAMFDSAINIAQQVGALDGGAGPGRVTVSKSEILPGGLVQQVLSDGTVRIVSPSEADAALIKQSEDRGVELTSSRAGGRTEAVELQKLRSDINKRITTSFQDAPVQIRSLKRVLNVFEDAGTGTGEAFLVAAGKVLPGATPANIENALAASGDFVINSLSKLKGPITEKELAFMQTLSPQIRNSPEGNKLIINRAIQAQEDELALSRAMRQWKRDGGNLENFDVDKFINEKEDARNEKFNIESIQPSAKVSQSSSVSSGSVDAKRKRLAELRANQ